MLLRGRRDAASRARALFDGFGSLLRENLDRLRRASGKDAAGEKGMPTIDAAGGLSRDPHFVQAIADRIAVPIRVADVSDTTLRGVARLAVATATGEDPFERRSPRSLATFEPRVSPGEARTRHSAWKRTFADALALGASRR